MQFIFILDSMLLQSVIVVPYFFFMVGKELGRLVNPLFQNNKIPIKFSTALHDICLEI